MAVEMKKEVYDPREAELRIQKFWEKQGIFKFDPKSKKKIYSVDTPPPTVSGEMHVGHSFSYTQQDAIIRYKRMKGFNVFYPFGTDDNGLATERLIEKTKGVKAKDMDREKFIKLCLDTLKDLRKKYLDDWKRLGISCDWDIFYSTIDDHSRKISQRSFIELYEKGREIRKEAPTIWCPECSTAIAQVELEDKEGNALFNDIVFKVGGKDLIISTTRPELLPSCVAVFYNPDDKRYKGLKGKKAKVPLFDFEVPILPDEKADPEKGTGIVMCCTFGDQNDMEWWKQHGLPLKISIDKHGHMNELAGKYKGMFTKKARKYILEDLKNAGLLKGQKQIQHVVNVHERCGTPIEFLVTKQWFIRYLDLRKKFLDLGSKLNWYPKHMKVRYDNWVKGLKWDWCISRQRYFGIPFPVWYCEKCDEVVLADRKQLPVDPISDSPPIKKCKCGSTKFVPEKDILDTWATSSLTPALAVELMPKNLIPKLFPMALRPQAHDIITFWLFNTVVKSYLHTGKLPWKDVTVSGFVLDPHGKKMSKSKGNVIAPQEMMDKYSGDSLRFAACATNLGEDMPFQEKELVAGKKMVNKLWNASKFVFMHFDKKPSKPKKLVAFDEWMLGNLNGLINESTESFEKYEYAHVKVGLEKFFWHVFSDDYLEIIKNRIYNGTKEEKQSAQYVLYKCLLEQLKILAPIMPYISEELYQKYFFKNEKIKSIHILEWPKMDKIKALKGGDKAVEIIHEVRKAKSQASKSLKTPIILTLDKKDEKELSPFLEDLKSVTNSQEIKWGKFSVEFA
ncbi:valine--tRNA ligase [Nanoarchaeota archaeon]